MPAITITDLNNAKTDVDHIAAIATSTAPTSIDRLGNVKKTVAGAVATIISINNRGAWGTATIYATKDIVSVAGTWYVCVVVHTSSAAFATDAANWRVYQGVISGDLAASTGSGLVGYLPAGVGAVATNMQVKQRERKSLLDFMSDALKTVTTAGVTYTAQNRADMLIALNAAWASALAAPHDLYAPAGRFELGDYSFPWRQSIVTSLLDCKNVTLYCHGPATVFATVSAAGADVFQLNGMKNFNVKGFPTLTASLTATSGAGSNGCSVTNGFDNITLEIAPTNCQSRQNASFTISSGIPVVGNTYTVSPHSFVCIGFSGGVMSSTRISGTSEAPASGTLAGTPALTYSLVGEYIDGGKGLSIQCDAATLEVGTLKSRVMSKQCSQGFGFESGLVNFLTKKTAVNVDLVAEDCFVAVTIGGGAATGAIPAGTHTGVRVKGQAINCQKDVQLARAHGVMVDMQIITTKTEAARRLDPQGSFWFAPDQLVEALFCAYAKNSQISVTGNKGACAYKARIGGTAAGSSGLSGATEHCNIFLDITGTASVVDILSVDSGGNVMSNSTIEITQTTSATLHNDFYLASRSNTLVIGPACRLKTPKFAGRTSFALGTDGVTESAAIDLFGVVTGLQGKGTPTTGAVVAGLYDNGGTLRIGIMNGNGLVIDTATSSSALGAYISKYAVYTPAGVLIGHFPIYA